MKDWNITVTLEEALLQLKRDTQYIHVFMQAKQSTNGDMLVIGMEYDRDEIYNILRKAPEIVLPGDIAEGMSHCLAVEDQGQWLFVETQAPEQATR